MKPRNAFELEPTPELIALADDLRREAKRRNRTARARSHWMLMAAALPLALAFGGVSLWGIAQKHRAEDLAAAMAQKDAQITQMANALNRQPDSMTARQAPGKPLMVTDPDSLKRAHKSKGKELIIPVEQPAGLVPQDTTQVKSH
jgi:hypothetical protein